MDFSFGDLGVEISAINPAALPPSKNRKITLEKVIRNMLTILYIIGFCTLFRLFFGTENILISATIATASLSMRKAVLGIKTPQAALSILLCYLLIAFGPLVGGLNLFLAIPINLGCLYVITLLMGQNVLQKSEYNFVAAYIFAESTPASPGNFWLRFLCLMAGACIVAGVYYVSHQQAKRQRSIAQVLENTHLTSTRNRYAMRLAGGLALTMLIGDIFSMHYAAWMGMPVLSLSMPFVQDTRKRVFHRLIGTLLGGGAFLLLFSYVIPEFLHVWILMALLYLYLFITDYRIQQMLIAIFSLNGAAVFYGNGVAFEMRLLLFLVGAAIVFAMNIIEYFDVADRVDCWYHRRKRASKIAKESDPESFSEQSEDDSVKK